MGIIEIRDIGGKFIKLDKSFPFFIGVTKLIFQSEGKQPVEREKLNRYNNGEARTNLHLVKKRFDIISGPGLVLLVIKSNSFKIGISKTNLA